MTDNLGLSAAFGWNPKGSSLALTYLEWMTGKRISILGLVSEDGTSAKRLFESKEALLSNPTWSPDGESIAILEHPEEKDSTLRILAPDGSERFQISVPRGAGLGVPSIAWSPDGKWIAAVLEEKLLLFDVLAKTYKVVGSTRYLFTSLQRPQWAPDSSAVAFLVAGGANVYKLSEEKGFRLLVDGRIQRAAWFPDSRHMLLLASLQKDGLKEFLLGFPMYCCNAPHRYIHFPLIASMESGRSLEWKDLAFANDRPSAGEEGFPELREVFAAWSR